MKIIFGFTMLASMLFPMANANAFVGKISRACRFDQLPPPKSALAYFFQKMGAPAEFANMADRSIAEQSMYWINESLTTDYFQVRYYLFATSDLYIWQYTGFAYRYVHYGTTKSNWSVEQVLEAVRNDPLLSPSYVNRGPTPWYSARAGNPNILERWSYGGNYNTPVPINTTFLVLGEHFYYDNASKSQVDLGESTATNCNITNAGFGIFDR